MLSLGVKALMKQTAEKGRLRGQPEALVMMSVGGVKTKLQMLSLQGHPGGCLFSGWLGAAWS